MESEKRLLIDEIKLREELGENKEELLLEFKERTRAIGLKSTTEEMPIDLKTHIRVIVKKDDRTIMTFNALRETVTSCSGKEQRINLRHLPNFVNDLIEEELDVDLVIVHGDEPISSIYQANYSIPVLASDDVFICSLVPIHSLPERSRFMFEKWAQMQKPDYLDQFGSTFEIFVKCLTGICKTLVVSPTMKISEVKLLLYRSEDLPVLSQRLLFSGRQLDDENTVDHCNIRRESTIHLVMRLRGGKPVIVFHPIESIDDTTVTVSLSDHWKFGSLYPIPESNTEHMVSWNISVDETGIVTSSKNKRQFPYLFWEADTDYTKQGELFFKQQLEEQPLRFCVSSENVSEWLDMNLERLGLDVRERCDMITYWLGELLAHPFNKITFMDMKTYNSIATLKIEPKPDHIRRVFMLFEGVDEMVDVDVKGPMDVPEVSKIDGYYVTEWGGMNVGKHM